MADLSYTVEVKGVQDLDRLEGTIDKLHATLNAGKGAGKSLEEVRKIIVGLKGSESVFQRLDDAVRSLAQASSQTERAVKESIGGLSQTIKSEMHLLRQTMQTAGIAAGKDAAVGIAKGFEQGEDEVVRKVKGAAAKARAIMTAEYNKVVEGNGLKALTTDEAALVAMLKHQGATISTYHSKMVSNYEDSLKQQRRADNTFYAEQQRLVLAGHDKKLSMLNAQVAASRKAHEEQAKLDNAEHRRKVDLINAQINLSKKAHAERLAQEAAELAAAKKTLEERVRRSVSSATNATAAPYQVYNPTTGLAGAVKNLSSTEKSFNDTSKAAGGLSKAFSQLTISGNDVHSMSRGLASGFNLLWLTWGNLAPLFAGAVVSNGFMQTAKSGMEVAHTLEIVTHLGENSAESMKALTGELVHLGYNGPRAPLEIAEALKTLSLAGLRANEILAVTGTVLNFSTAGTTDIQTAADVLVSVTTAFGTGAAGFERSADIIMRAAADSKASVESFGEALKTASVVGEQYGATQEDVALMIQYLAQVGIQGSAAGTAIRNMMADITGRSGQVAKVLKSLNLDFKDANGQVVSLQEQMRMLSGVLKDYDAKSQGNIIQAIFGERGAKAAIAALQAYQTAAKDSATFSNKLEEDYFKLANAAGDSAIAAAKLAETTQNSFKAVGATMRTTMFVAFQEMEPELYRMAKILQEAFADESTKNALVSLTHTVAQIGQAVAENLEPLTKLVLLWGSYRVALAAASSVITAVIAVKTAYSRATAAATAATLAESAATDRLTAAKARAAVANAGLTGAVLRSLPVIGNLVALGSAGWMVYSTMVDRAGNSAHDFATDKTKSITQKLKEENDWLERVNAERLKGIGLEAAEANLRKQDEVSRIDKEAQADIDARKRKISELSAEVSKYQNLVDKGYKGYSGQLQQATIALNNEQGAIGGVLRARGEAIAALEVESERRRKNAKDAQLIAAAETQQAANQANNLIATGEKAWNLLDFQQQERGERMQRFNDKSIQAIRAYYDSRLSVATDAYNREKKILDAQRSGELLSEAEYLRRSNDLTANYEREQLAMLQEAGEKYKEQYAKQRAEIEAARAKSSKPEQYNQALENLKAEEIALEEKTSAARQKIVNEANDRIMLSYINLEAAVGKLIKTDKEFWTARGQESDKQKQAFELEKAYDNINTSIFSSESAMYAYVKAQKAAGAEVRVHIDKLREQLAIQKEILLAQEAQILNAVTGSSVDDAELQRLTEQAERTRGAIKRIGETIETATEKGLEDGAKAGMLAFEQEARKQALALRDEVSSAIVEGITGDGASAGKRLRNILQRELLNKPLEVFVRALLTDIVGGGITKNGAAEGSGVSSTLGSVFNIGQKAYSYANSPLLQNFGVASAGYIQQFGGTLYSMGMESLGEGIVKIGNSVAEYADAINTGASVLSYAAAAYNLSQGKYGAAAGGAIGAYFGGPIGSAIGSTIGGMVDSLFAGDSGTSHMGAGAIYTGGKLTEGKSIYNRATFGMGAPGEWNVGTQQLISGVVTSLGGALDSYAKAFGKEAGYTLSAAFADDSSGDGAWGSLKISDAVGNVLVDWAQNRESKWAPKIFADGEQGVKEYLDTVAVSVRDAFIAMDVSGWSKAILSAATDMESLNSALTQISGINSQFEMLASTMSMFKDISTELETGLLAAAGSMETLVGAVNSYYGSSIFSEHERMLNLRDQQMAALKSVGLYIDPAQGDAAKELFRKTVEEAMSSGQSELAFRLMAMAESFASVADYATNLFAETAKEAEEAAKKAEEAAKASVDSAFKILEAAINREKLYWQEVVDTTEESISKVRSVLDALNDSADKLYGSVSSTASRGTEIALTRVKEILLAIRDGKPLGEFSDLEDVVATATEGVGKKVYASEAERRREALTLAGRVVELSEFAQEQLSTDEKILEAALQELDKLDKTLEYWKQQVDGTAEIINTNISIEAAVKELASAIALRDSIAAGGGAGGGGGGGGGGSYPGELDGVMHKIAQAWSSGDWLTAQNYIRGQGISNSQLQSAFDLNYADLRYLFNRGITGENPGTYTFSAKDPMALYEEAKSQGISLSEVDKLLGANPGDAEAWAKANGLPVYHDGTNYVQRTGLALLEEGEAVVPRRYNSEPYYEKNSSGSSEDSYTLQEIRHLLSALVANTGRLPDLANMIEDAGDGVAPLSVRIAGTGQKI